MRDMKVRIVAIMAAALALLSGCMIQPNRDPSRLDLDLAVTVTVPAQQELPGTGIRYEYQDNSGAHVSIDGQPAVKRKGDSLYWKGNLAEGVYADQRLRVVWHSDENLTLAGTVKLKLTNIAPSSGQVVTSSRITFSGPIAYSLATGAQIPGTTITYKGSTDEGAEFSGIDGYAFRRIGDSILWEGVLRDGVYLRLEGRVVQYNSSSLRVAGIVSVWIGA